MRALDLFCGAGGLSAGLHEAGWDTVVALDADAAACRTYEANFPDTKVVTADAAVVDYSQFSTMVDLVAGGPPCQPFSVAGKQLARSDPRDCVPHFIRAVRQVQPTAFLLENVAGLAAIRHRDYLFDVQTQLAQLGYFVQSTVLDAADFGVPQHRLRLFIVGIRNQNFSFPTVTHGPQASLPHVAAGKALVNPPDDEANRAIVTYAKNPVLRPQPWDGMLVNGGGRPINLAEPSQTIPASAGGNRTHIVDTDGVLVEYHQHLMSGGEPRTGIVEGVRRLSVRESARLQSFADDFVILGNQSTRYRLVGNAVPPVLAEAVGRALRSQISGESIGTSLRPAQLAFA